MRLNRLGDARETLQEQRHYLVRVSRVFSSLVKSAVDGVYVNEFFGDAKTHAGYNKRLRAVLQNHLLDFADLVRLEGHSQEIVEDEKVSKDVPEQISKSEFLDDVRNLMRRSRGRELPGTFNPLIVGDLFYQQALPWKSLTERCIAKILHATRTCLELILDHVADENTRDGLLREIIVPAMEKYDKELQVKVAEIMRPHQRGHPITYNHYFTETIQKARQEHTKNEQRRLLNAFFNLKQDAGPNSQVEQRFLTGALLNALNTQTEADMDRFACSEALYCMAAYYKVSVVL